MLFHGRRIAIALVTSVALPVLPHAAAALPSTEKGQISVDQVMQMIAKADTSAVARQVLVAYVAGVGETIGAVVETMGGKGPVSCARPFSLDAVSLQATLRKGAPGEDSWSQTPATPIIVADMIKRAGCRIRN
jgi:hypothetical protein